MIYNLYIMEGDGDYFGLASIDIQAGSDAGGAFSASLANIGGGSYGRNLDFVLIAKNPYLNKNGNIQPHVFVQSRHVLSALTSYSQGGHYMNPTASNAGGYAASKGRAFVITQVKAALIAAGIPANDATKILNISRRVANGGSGATGADILTDNVTLLTEFELFGTHSYSNPTYEPASAQTYFSEFYIDNATRIKRKADGEAVWWWEASPAAGNTNNFCHVGTTGPAYANPANSEFGIAPAFAIG
jgi:hypothetical protein